MTAPVDSTAEAMGPRVIKKSIFKQAAILVACVVFTFACLQMLHNPNPRTVQFGWVGLVFFGGGGLICLVFWLNGHGDLLLDDEGFSFASLFRKFRYEWCEVTPFKVVVMNVRGSSTKMIGFSATNETSKWQRLNSQLIGTGRALSNIYTLSPEKLVDLLNAYRTNALKGKTPAPD